MCPDALSEQQRKRLKSYQEDPEEFEWPRESMNTNNKKRAAEEPLDEDQTTAWGTLSATPLRKRKQWKTGMLTPTLPSVPEDDIGIFTMDGVEEAQRKEKATVQVLRLKVGASMLEGLAKARHPAGLC